MLKRRTAVVAASIALVALAAAGCNRGSSSGGGGASGGSGGGGGGKVGIDQPRSDSDFWNSYAKYVESDIKTMGIDALPRTNSQNQITQLAANVKTLVAQGAKAIVMAPRTPRRWPPRWRTWPARTSRWSPWTPGPTRARCTWWYGRTTVRTARRPAS